MKLRVRRAMFQEGGGRAVPLNGYVVIDESWIDALEDADEFSCRIHLGGFTGSALVYATSTEISGIVYLMPGKLLVWSDGRHPSLARRVCDRPRHNRHFRIRVGHRAPRRSQGDVEGRREAAQDAS